MNHNENFCTKVRTTLFNYVVMSHDACMALWDVCMIHGQSDSLYAISHDFCMISQYNVTCGPYDVLRALHNICTNRWFQHIHPNFFLEVHAKFIHMTLHPIGNEPLLTLLL